MGGDRNLTWYPAGHYVSAGRPRRRCCRPPAGLRTALAPHRRRAGPPRAADHQAPRLLLAQLVELVDAPRGEPPGVAELIEAQQSLDDDERILGNQIAVLVPGLFEQHRLDAPGAIVERQDHPWTAFLHLIDEPGDGDGLPAAEAPRLEAGERAVAHEVADAVRDEARQRRLEARERMTREVQAERLALAGETHRFAPLRQRRRVALLRLRGALLAGQSEQVILARLVRAVVLVAELHGGGQAV